MVSGQEMAVILGSLFHLLYNNGMLSMFIRIASRQFK